MRAWKELVGEDRVKVYLAYEGKYDENTEEYLGLPLEKTSEILSDCAYYNFLHNIGPKIVGPEGEEVIKPFEEWSNQEILMVACGVAKVNIVAQAKSAKSTRDQTVAREAAAAYTEEYDLE